MSYLNGLVVFPTFFNLSLNSTKEILLDNRQIFFF